MASRTCSASSARPTWTRSTCSRPAGIRFIPTAHEQGAGAHGGRLFARLGQARRVHRAERPGHHQFRDRDGRRLLGAFAGGRASRRRPAPAPSASAASRRPSSCRSSPRSPSTRRMSSKHPRMAELTGALLRHGDGRARADPAQHPARQFLRRGRLRDRRSRASIERAARGADDSLDEAAEHAGQGQVPGDRVRRRRHHLRRHQGMRRRWPSSSDGAGGQLLSAQ